MGPLAYNYFRLHPPSTAVLSTPVLTIPTAKHLRCFFWLLETVHERLSEAWCLQSPTECLTPFSPPRPARRRTPGDAKFEASVSGDDLLTHARSDLSRSGLFVNAKVFPRSVFNHVRGAYGR